MIRAKIYSTLLLSLVAINQDAALRAQRALPDKSAPQQAATSMQTSTPAAQPALEQRYPRYMIQLQDVLFLAFPLSPEMNQTVTVQPDGYINLQTGGSVHVQGLTVPELADALKRAYTGTLHDPIINVDLVDFQKPFFTVSGQVGKPGQYELRASITVAEAIAIAGGLTPTAKTQIFLFNRTSHDWYEVRKLNLQKVLNGKHLTENAIVKPGDMIFVPEKFITNFRKYFPYGMNVGSYATENVQ